MIIRRSIGLFIEEENGALKFSEGMYNMKYDYVAMLCMYVATYIHHCNIKLHLCYQFQSISQNLYVCHYYARCTDKYVNMHLRN